MSIMTIQSTNEAIDNMEQRGIFLDGTQQRQLLYDFRNLIKGKDKAVKELSTLRDRLAVAEKALRDMPCTCRSLPITACPQCKGSLKKVTYPSDSVLNRDQFDSVRAGDWYCTNCKGTEASSGYKYWWHGDLGKSNQQCSRCAALADLGVRA